MKSPAVESRAPLPVSDPDKMRALPWSIIGTNLTSTVFGTWTVFGSVFLMYLRELGVSKAQIGIVLSLFPFCQLIAPFVAAPLARLGTKRVFVGAFAARSLVFALLLLLPLVVAEAGQAWAGTIVTAVVLVFAVLRALGETALYPWTQEYLPERVRGKYSAVSSVVAGILSLLALAVAGYVIAHGHGLGRFLWLQGAGCAVGVVGALLLLKVPGGRPVPAAPDQAAHWAEMRQALRDTNFRFFLYGTAGIALVGATGAFLPLLLAEKVGFPAGTVIWLDSAAMIGGLATCFAWGWLADRYGSRTALMPGLTLSLAVSVAWGVVATTRVGDVLGVPGIAALLLVGGIATSAVGIGSGRLLLTGIVPPDKSVAYMAIFYSWLGLCGGFGSLLAGGILAVAAKVHTGVDLPFADPYAVLFLLSLIPAALGWLFFVRTRPDGATRTRDLLSSLATRAGDLMRL